MTAPKASMSGSAETSNGDPRGVGREWRWHMPLWCGMDLVAWTRLLRRHHFAVDAAHWHWAALISGCAVGNTILRRIQDAVWGNRVERTTLAEAPVFVIGHWRSGTSLLHELLARDPRHVVPTTYECLFPNHFLLTEAWLTRLLQFILPSHRPMDAMPMSWDGPLEDEYAMCNIGEPSPYLAIAFPNDRQARAESLNMDAMAPADVERWKRSLLRFLRQITMRSPKRIVLKSPPHTCRIKVLLELFPDARFVHIVRDPLAVFPSTLHLWRRLYQLQGLQTPTFEGLEDYVLDTFVDVFERLHECRTLIPPSHFHELRYEDLVRSPVDVLRTVYERLDLGDFTRVEPHVQAYANHTSHYRPNRYTLTPAQRARIADRWGPVIQRYGYA